MGRFDSFAYFRPASLEELVEIVVDDAIDLNEWAPYWLEFAGHPKLRGVLAKRLRWSLEEDVLMWLPPRRGCKWQSISFDYLILLRVALK